ncbi:ABC transporter substrate-binding protein [Rathayibacter sp. CAU 1779]
MKLSRSKVAVAAALAVATSIALSACGTTRAAVDDSVAAKGSLSVTDARGTTVKLDGPAKRVVATEWDAVETLVSVGVQPVGVADPKGYAEWDTSEPLEAGVKDIGQRGEPSVDTVAALDPDLVVATSDLSDSAIAQLSKVAPVIVVRSANASRQVDQMLDNVKLIATATGTLEQATKNIAAFEKTVADGKKKLAAAGLGGTKFAFADGWQEGDQVSIRPYASGSLIGDVSEELGLVNAWTMKGDKDYGLASTDVEGLTTLGDVRFAYISNTADGGDPFADGLKGNAVWNGLPMVQDHHVYKLPDGIWMFGTTSAMSAYVGALVDALTSK